MIVMITAIRNTATTATPIMSPIQRSVVDCAGEPLGGGNVMFGGGPGVVIAGMVEGSVVVDGIDVGIIVDGLVVVGLDIVVDCVVGSVGRIVLKMGIVVGVNGTNIVVGGRVVGGRVVVGIVGLVVGGVVVGVVGGSVAGISVDHLGVV